MSCCRLVLIFPGRSFVFFPRVALSVLVTHCLETGNVYVSFSGSGKREGDKAKVLCDCGSARLTDKTLIAQRE